MMALRLLVVLLAVTLALPASAADRLVTIQGNVAPALQDATYVRHSDPAKVLTIVVGLKLRNESEFADLLNRLYDPNSPDYHRWITPQDFLSRFSPSQGDVAAVRQHLESHGLTINRVSDNRVLVQATGTVAQVEEAFAININVYKLGAETHFSNDRNPSVPSILKDVVESVAGLTSLETMRRASNFENSRAASVTYTPWEIATIYNFPSRLNSVHGKTIYDGTGVTIAIATADTYSTSDVEYFWTYYTSVQRTGTLTNICVIDCSSQLDFEPTLDVEYAGAQAPGANLVVYEAGNTLSDFELMYSQMASDNSAQVVSISWGNCEGNLGPPVMKTIDTSFAQMAGEGITIFAGSGDYGAYGYIPGGCGGQPMLQIGFPPSDPNVTAVGGTSLYATSLYKYKSESAWTDSGGGSSSYFAQPSWQVGPGVPTNGSRDIPDIAFDADGNTGYYTYYQGVWYSGSYGTSFGGPNMAGYWALVLQALKGKKTGNAAPLFYKLGASSSYHANLHDVTKGNNGAGIGPGYNATKNWDFTTGWGSPNGTSLVNWLKKNP